MAGCGRADFSIVPHRLHRIPRRLCSTPALDTEGGPSFSPGPRHPWRFSPLPNQKAVVTGGAGFIGSRLCRPLLERGSSVTCLDSFSTGSGQSLGSLAWNPGFEFQKAAPSRSRPCRRITSGEEVRNARNRMVITHGFGIHFDCPCLHDP
ncbi:MAG: NAD-dependent epimerase/dehydratase family protein [Nitrososphaerota archaeon]|nr:NAD-dependent epimerase/dehydratase family protein [Nitrososphaerota archaeon]MDG6952540.1 NAD-dependent epimerase/dehydratase family protein [Nitrososphaerota archaeon]